MARLLYLLFCFLVPYSTDAFADSKLVQMISGLKPGQTQEQVQSVLSGNLGNAKSRSDQYWEYEGKKGIAKALLVWRDRKLEAATVVFDPPLPVDEVIGSDEKIVEIPPSGASDFITEWRNIASPAKGWMWEIFPDRRITKFYLSDPWKEERGDLGKRDDVLKATFPEKR